jgi:MinD-like ATPase involved in chromosome partitioning or flagellar assembly
MGVIVSVHSFRGGTGKSNVTANVAYRTASRGRTVAVIDTDLQSPGVHVVLGLEKERIVYTLSDFLAGRCELEEAAYDLTRALQIDGNGRLHLLPSSMKLEDITRIIADGYDAETLNTHFRRLLADLRLDFLFIDTHPGLNRETLLTTAISNVLIILIRPDEQDFHGTAVLATVARRLGVPHIFMVANKVASPIDRDRLREKIRTAFGYEVIGALPFSEEMLLLGSKGLLSSLQPDLPFSRELEKVVERLLETGGGEHGN